MPDYPEDLQHPISRGDLSLLGAGWREVTSGLWRSPYRGVHVWGATDPADGLQRALDASPLLPKDGALGGWAAARVGGVLEFDGVVDGELLPVPLCLPPSVRRRRGPTVVVWRSVLLPEDVTVVDGVPLTVPVRTAFDLGRMGSFLAAVTALDVLGRARPEFFEEVRAYADERPRWRGVPQLRAALRFATARARSPRETTLRLLWLDCDLPTPEVNALVRDGAGHVLGMGDLLDPASGLVGEYDGGGHREERQHALDNAREEDLENGGLTVVRVSNPDLGPFLRRTRVRLVDGLARARQAPRGNWTWEPGPMPDPVPHW